MNTEKAQAFLSELEAAAKEATDGKWEYDLDENEVHALAHQEFGGDPLHIMPPSSEYCIQKNGPFIALANPITISALLADRKALIEALENCHKKCIKGLIKGPRMDREDYAKNEGMFDAQTNVDEFADIEIEASWARIAELGEK
jgi:hypothetical protein